MFYLLTAIVGDLGCPWRSFPYCKPFQVRFLVFVARRAVPLHLESFLSLLCSTIFWWS